MPQTTAAGLLALIGVFDIVGTIASGWLTDRFDPRGLLAATTACAASRCWLLPTAAGRRSAAQHDRLHRLLRAGLGGHGPAHHRALPAQLRRRRRVVFGWVFASHLVGAAAAALGAGAIRDATGQYTYAWFGAAAMCTIAAVISATIRKDAGNAGTRTGGGQVRRALSAGATLGLTPAYAGRTPDVAFPAACVPRRGVAGDRAAVSVGCEDKAPDPARVSRHIIAICAQRAYSGALCRNNVWGHGMALLAAKKPGTEKAVNAATPAGAWYRSRLARGIAGELVTLLAVLAAALFMSARLDVWGEQGLDFSVSTGTAAKILNEAGQAPSNLYSRTVGWAGGPELPFTYPPFAALPFGLLARLPEESALMLFNAAGAAVAVWVAVRGVRYWSAKQDWRNLRSPRSTAGSGFKATRNRWGAVILLLAVINLGPWRETLAFGQINILLMGLMAADLLARNQRWNQGFPGRGFLVGMAAGIKLTPLVFGLYFLVRKDWRGLFNMAAGFAAAPCSWDGWSARRNRSGSGWRSSRTPPGSAAPATWTTSPLKGALLHFGVPEAGVTVPWLLLSLLVVAVGAVVIRPRATRDQRGGHLGNRAHHAAHQPRVLVPPLGVDRGRPAGVRLDPARDPAAPPGPPAG